MANRHDIDSTLSRLEEVTGLYGAETSRWPEAEREALCRLIDTDADAGRMFKEAQALDQVLAHAPSLAASDALKERILESALPVHAGSGARIIPLAERRGRLRGSLAGVVSASRAWPAAGLLAASLALGLYLGVSGLTLGADSTRVELAGVSDIFGGDSDMDPLLPSISLEDGVVQSEDLL